MLAYYTKGNGFDIESFSRNKRVPVTVNTTHVLFFKIWGWYTLTLIDLGTRNVSQNMENEEETTAEGEDFLMIRFFCPMRENTI